MSRANKFFLARAILNGFVIEIEGSGRLLYVYFLNSTFCTLKLDNMERETKKILEN